MSNPLNTGCLDFFGGDWLTVSLDVCHKLTKKFGRYQIKMRSKAISKNCSTFGKVTKTEEILIPPELFA
ncbi:hypothetical protein GCM10008912_03950 [Pediococcus parvulus]|nr:hypothetical protein GCM10008912_03950 [Pediococcus parvulus]